MTKSEVPYEEAGVADLKGISGKVRLYRVPKVTDASYGPKDLIPAQNAGLLSAASAWTGYGTRSARSPRHRSLRLP
jgi:hypothetical protein